MAERPYDCILFDLDGTLSDSVELILMAYRHTMRAHLGTELPDERWIAGIGIPLEIQLSEFARDEVEAQAMRETYAKFYIEHHDAHITMFPGAMEAVASLRKEGISIGMVTSKSRVGANRTLRLYNLESAFDAVITADDTDKGKPDPQPVFHALELLGHSPSKTAFVGDSPHDLHSGRGAGVTTVAVSWGPFPLETLQECRPDRWLDKPEDIISLNRPA